MTKFQPIHYGDLCIRPATHDDNPEQIANLIYQTDPYIYPCWFKGHQRESDYILGKLVHAVGSVFYYDNITVAEDLPTGKIIGIICALERTTPLHYDYTDQKALSPNADRAITEYIEWLVQQARQSDFDTITISNCCVDPYYRSRKVGQKLFGTFIHEADKQQYHRIQFDCLADNAPAIRLYTSFGCRITCHGTGFSGPDQTPPAVVDFIRERYR